MTWEMLADGVAEEAGAWWIAVPVGMAVVAGALMAGGWVADRVRARRETDRAIADVIREAGPSSDDLDLMVDRWRKEDSRKRLDDLHDVFPEEER